MFIFEFLFYPYVSCSVDWNFCCSKIALIIRVRVKAIVDRCGVESQRSLALAMVLRLSVVVLVNITMVRRATSNKVHRRG
jgi:hypothetical protein